MTFGPAEEFYPVWTPDGRRLIFNSTRAGARNVFWQPADGTSTVERLTTSPNNQFPSSISADGKRLVMRETSLKTADDLSLVLLDGQPRTEPLIHTGFGEANGELSSDGRWLSYQSNESGRDEIYVRPFPNVDGGRWQISTHGGKRPLWARSGRELFYLDANGFLMTAPVQSAPPSFSAGTPTKVFEGRYCCSLSDAFPGRTYDVSQDGQRFLMIKEKVDGDLTATPASIVVVLNWFEELKRRVPNRRR